MGTLPTIPKKDNKIKPAEKMVYTKRCTCCGQEYNKVTDFLMAPSSPWFRNNSGRMSVCRGCVEAAFDRYQEQFGTDEAIRRICMKFDLYYSPNIVKSSADMGAYKSRIASYISKLNMAAYHGKTYDTTIHEENNLAMQSYDDLDAQQEEREFKVTREMVNTWGLNFSVDEYEFLENEYADWYARCVISGKAKEELVRDLCILKLQMNKAILDNKVDSYTKLTDTYQKTLDRAELTPKIEAQNEKLTEIPLGVMIKNFEDHDPIPEPLEEWKDVDGIRHFYSVYFLGHLCKMLGIKNRHSDLYEAEMNKYRAEIPDLEDADDEDVFDAIMNRAMSGSADGEDLTVSDIIEDVASGGDT